MHSKILASVTATADSVVKRISRRVENGRMTDQEFRDLMTDKVSLYSAINAIEKEKSGDVGVSDADIEERVRQRLSTLMKRTKAYINFF